MVNAVIWKFPVPIRGDNRPNVVTMPIGAVILSAGVQQDQIFVWAKCDPMAKTEPRHLRAVMTEPFDDEGMTFIATVHPYSGQIVAHVFEVKP